MFLGNVGGPSTATWRYIPEDRILLKHSYENLKSNQNCCFPSLTLTALYRVYNILNAIKSFWQIILSGPVSDMNQPHYNWYG
jgi:hypothetical protein